MQFFTDGAHAVRRTLCMLGNRHVYAPDLTPETRALPVCRLILKKKTKTPIVCCLLKTKEGFQNNLWIWIHHGERTSMPVLQHYTVHSLYLHFCVLSTIMVVFGTHGHAALSGPHLHLENNTFRVSSVPGLNSNLQHLYSRSHLLSLCLHVSNLSVTGVI